MNRTVLRHPNAQPPKSPYSPGLRVGPLVFLSGQTGVHPQTGELAGSIEGQVRQALENMRALLAGASAPLASVVAVTVFVTKREDVPGMNAVYREFFTEPFPTRATVVVAGLGRPELLIEMQAVAYIAD